MVYERNLNGSLVDTPVRIIRGPATGLHNPFDVEIDGLNRVWVANLGDPPANNPSITVYESNATGNTGPSFTLSLTRFGDFLVPGSLAKLGAEEMFVAGALGPFNMSAPADSFYTISGAKIIDSSGIFFSAPFSSAPVQLINPTGIAFNTDTLFVATSSLPMIFGLYRVPNPTTSAILLYGRGVNGFNPNSSSMIAGNNTGLSNPSHIQFDRSGNLYVLNRGIPGSPNSLPSITVYGQGQRGNIAPIRIIRGQNTRLVTPGSPYGLAVDENGFIYVSTENSIVVFDQTANGNVSPVHTRSNTTLSNSRNADLSSPVGIAVR